MPRMMNIANITTYVLLIQEGRKLEVNCTKMVGNDCLGELTKQLIDHHCLDE